MRVDNEVSDRRRRPGDQDGSINSEDNFLPQVGATYRINADNELFAGYTENMRAFGAAHTGLSPFATTQAGFDATKGTH